ncbi:MAG: hypothetical protein LUB56_01955 [Coprobacillus sp.]|nr:hypothetical protein [Coprobacillus sp.]
MKNWYKSLSENYKTTLWTCFIVVIAFIAMIPLILNGKMEFPISIATGGLLGAIFYFCFGLSENMRSQKANNVVTLTIIIGRIFVVVGLTALFAFLYYRRDIHIFEPISFATSYFISLVVLLVVHLVNAHQEKKAHDSICE